jgi:hypothetical protein
MSASLISFAIQPEDNRVKLAGGFYRTGYPEKKTLMYLR